MKFNRKIVAAMGAVAIMSSGAALAGDISVSPLGTYYYSKEGLKLSGTQAVELPDIVVKFGNNLTYQDDILITLPGTTSVAVTPTPTTVLCSIAGSAVGYVQTVPGGWNFRVTAVSGITINDSCTFTGLAVQGASLASSNGKLVYQANRFGTGTQVDYDESSTSIVVKSQFGLTEVTKLDAEIDVYKDRLLFVDIPPVEASDDIDTLEFDTTIDGFGTSFKPGSPIVTVTDTDVTIENGSFDWTDTLPPVGVCFDSGLNGFSTTGWTVQAGSTCNSLILDGPATATTNSGTFQVPGNKILSPADWTGKVTWSYYYGATTNADTTTLTWDPGKWDINGAQVYIQYMPYATGISRIVYAANSGLINADATVDVIANGSTTTCDLGAINRKSLTILSGALDACVAGAGIVNGRVAFLLTFTAPDTDIEVYSAYNVGSDRGTVVNTSNGRALSYFSVVEK